MGRLTALLTALLLTVATNAYATVAFDSQGAGTGTTTLSWTHTTTTDPQGVIVMCINTTSSDNITAADWGGTALAEIATATDTAGETGRTEAYFLGVGVPTTDNPTVTCTTTGSGSAKWGFSIALTGSGDLTLAGTTGFCTAAENQANPSCSITGISGTSYAVAGLFDGQNSVTGTAGTGFTLGSTNDFGTKTSYSEYATTEQASGNWTCGFTIVTDDVAMVCIAVQEPQGGAPRRIMVIQ